MTAQILTALILFQCAGLAHAAEDALDRPRVLEHIRRKFSTPKSLTLSIGAMKASVLPGYMTGKISFGEGDKKKRARKPYFPRRPVLHPRPRL